MKTDRLIRSTAKIVGGFQLLSFSLLLLVLQQSCLGPLPSSRPVCGNCEGPNRFIRLEKISSAFPSEIHPPFSHPLTLDSQAWERILASIYVQKLKPGFLIGGGKEAKEQAFTPEEIGYLSTTLSKAFEQAQPDEVVTYALSQALHPPLSEISTGGLFVQNDELHVILANHRYVISMPTIRDLLWEHPLTTQATLYEMAQENHQTVQKSDWLEVKFISPQLVIAYKQLLHGLPDSLTDHQRLSPPVLSTEPPPSAEHSIGERLKILNRLKTQDLITEEEFEKKRKELLDRF